MDVHIAAIDPDDELPEAFRAVGAPAIDPAAADVILMVLSGDSVKDPFHRILRHHPLVREHRSKVFVYDQRDQPLYTFPGIYVSGTPGWARRHKLMIGGPFVSSPSSLAPLISELPDLLFSFRGSMTHPVRDAVLALRHPRAILERTRAQTFYEMDEAKQNAARAEMNELTSRSKFILCPRGYGASSYRLFETLGAGRVPVVISDEWLPPPRVDWPACIVRVADRDVSRIPQILERREADWDGLAAAGREVYEREFAPASIWAHYTRSLAALAAARTRISRPWWLDRRALRLSVAAIARR